MDREKQIEDLINTINDTANKLNENDNIVHTMVISYVDIGDAKGFVSASANLDHLESQATFLLDYLSRSIKDGVRKTVEKQKDDLKNIIEKEENKDENK